MKNFILIFCFSIGFQITTAQLAGFNYIPLEFVDLEPVWSHVSIDSTLINHEIKGSTATNDGYTHLSDFFDVGDQHIVHEGFLYLITRALYDIDIAGAMIEKIDIETGELVWKSTFDLRDSPRREFVYHAMIFEDVLRLYNLSITSPTPEPIPVPIVALGSAEGYLKVREYDLLSGNLVTNTTPDTLANPLMSIETSNLRETVLNFITPDSIEVIRHMWRNVGTALIIDTINILGEYINTTDTIWTTLPADLDWPNSFRLNARTNIRDAQGDLYWIDYFSPGDTTVNKPTVHLDIVRKDSIEVISLNIPNQREIRGWFIVDVDENSLLFRVTYYDDSRALLLMDKTGTLIWQVDVQGNLGSFIELGDNNEILFGKFDNRVDGRWQMGVYKIVEDELIKKSSFSMSNELYGCFPDELQKLDNGDILFSLSYSQIDGLEQGAGRGSFSSIMRVRPDQLGLVPVLAHSNAETEVIFKVYPNPFKDQFTVEIRLNDPVTLNLFSVDGKLLNSYKNISTREFQIPTASLPIGTYYLQLKGEEFSVTKSIIKIE